MNPGNLQYVLVTPARNEEDYIALTIESVIKQTVRPLRWAIVSDGSTDRTDEIIQRYAAEHPWIEYVRMPERTERHFAGKVGCFNAGYERLQGLDYQVIGSLDADITFDEHYFEFLLGKLAADPKLGLTGTPFSENGEIYDYRFSSVEHVSGACQVFRRECFESIGGYIPVKGGGIDTIAVLGARMRGWKTRTWPEKPCIHHRPMGSANSRSRLVSQFKLGRTCYREGFHPLWQLLRSIRQFSIKPYFLAGASLWLGYCWCYIRFEKRPISREMVTFQRKDQMRRLLVILHLRRNPSTAPS